MRNAASFLFAPPDNSFRQFVWLVIALAVVICGGAGILNEVWS